MMIFLSGVKSAFIAVIIFMFSSAAFGAGPDMVALPRIEMTVEKPVKARVVYEIELAVSDGQGALVSEQKKRAFIGVLKSDLCAELLNPGKGPEALWAMREGVLNAARQFFRPIVVKDVLFRQMSRWGPDPDVRALPLGLCRKSEEAL